MTPDPAVAVAAVGRRPESGGAGGPGSGVDRGVWTAWFGIGLGLTTATQLRLSSPLPVGVGEAMLAAWALWAGVRLLRRRRVPHTPPARALLAFWAVAAAALAAGRAVAVARGYAPTNGSALHDSLAFAFAAGVVLPFVAQDGLRERAPRAFLWMALAIVPPLALLALAGGGAGLVDAWHRGRFRGWAANPNQLALALLLVPFVVFLVARGHPRSSMRWLLRALAVAAVVLGLLTGSDALRVAWAAGGAAAAGLAWLRLARGAPAGSWARRAARGGVPALLLAALAVYGPAAARAARAQVQAEWRFEDAGAQRAVLLRNGVAAWSRSPLVGLGPGAHSGLRAPFGGDEAHNTLLDWGMSTGAAGAAALVALLGWAAARVLRGHGIVPAAGMAALLAFAAFHYVLRQPVFWAGLATLVALAERSSRPSPAHTT